MVNLVIVNDTGGFWTGTRWSCEYLNAINYTSKSDAINVRDSLGGTGANIIANYGYETETIIF